MASLKELFSVYNASTIDFRNNEKPDSEGNMWANAFVNDADKNLICIGATVETLDKIKLDPKMSNLMLTTPEKKTSAAGKEYFMCQLAIAKPSDFSFNIE